MVSVGGGGGGGGWAKNKNSSFRVELMKEIFHPEKMKKLTCRALVRCI